MTRTEKLICILFIILCFLAIIYWFVPPCMLRALWDLIVKK